MSFSFLTITNLPDLDPPGCAFLWLHGEDALFWSHVGFFIH